MATTPPSKQDIDAMVSGQTLASRFMETVATHPDQVALRWREGEGWGEWTYRDYADQVARAAGGLQRLGVGRGDRVVLMMRNRPTFHVADVAALMVGATPVSIYNSSAPEQIAYVVGHCGATVAVVEDAGFLDRFLDVRAELPALAHLVIVDDPEHRAPDGVVTWASLVDGPPLDLAAAAPLVAPEDIATVIYTSGTTGPPKGVLLSQYNVCWTIQSQLTVMHDDPLGFRLISYLPMAHIAERLTSHYGALAAGYEVTACPDPTQLGAYAREVRPEVLFGVPRVWEKIHAGVQAALAADPEKAARFNEGLAAAIPLRLKRIAGSISEEETATLDFLDEVAFAPVRRLVGLDAVRFAVTGAAPIPVEVLEWFVGIGLPMSEVYGMSENCGPLTWDPYAIRPGTVGRPMPGSEVRLAEDGEVVARGGHVFQGYLDDPERTAETLDEEGWLHTGDIGEMDEDGYLRIIDRKKELIITAGGKNVSPANLEAALKTITLVGQAAAIGDNRPFMSALVVLDPDVAPAWAKQRGIRFDTLADLAADGEVRAEIERDLERVMAPFSNAERVKKVAILPDEWMPDSEELTPTSKLKRRGIHARYGDEIEALYS